MDWKKYPFMCCILLVVGMQPLTAQSLEPSGAGSGESVREAQDIPNAARVDPNLQNPLALAPANDNCASATSLVVGATCISGTTDAASLQGGEYICINPGGGISPETVWYRFTATSTSMVLGVVLTNSSNCATVLAVYGPFGSGAGCLPSAGNQILCQNMGLIDPGFHPQLTGLAVGQDYLVQVQGNNCGGGNDRFANFCISINTPSTNQSAGTASVINNCGVAFTGGTTGGHFANGTSIGNNNLDNNNGTTITGGSETGDDVTFVINNVSWFTFCNGNVSSCNWSVLVNGISGCLLSGLNAGVQAAVFTGTPVALTNVAISPSRIAPGGSWNSGTFAVAASQCAYVMVDGFAGDECNYNLTLTNVSCPCNILPIELAYLVGRNMPTQIHLEWMMSAEDGARSYTVERSADGHAFSPLQSNIAVATEANYRYVVADQAPLAGWNYYRLSAVDADGTTSMLKTAAVFRQQGAGLELIANLSAESMRLDIVSPESGAATVEISDIQGRLVHTMAVNLRTGSNHIDVDASKLHGGMYIVKLRQGQMQVSKKVAGF